MKGIRLIAILEATGSAYQLTEDGGTLLVQPLNVKLDKRSPDNVFIDDLQNDDERWAVVSEWPDVDGCDVLTLYELIQALGGDYNVVTEEIHVEEPDLPPGC